MQKKILILFFLLITFSGFSADSSSDESSTFNKAFNFTIGVDLSLSVKQMKLVYTNYYMDLYKSIFGYKPEGIFSYIDFDAIGIGLPISFLFFINPYIALGFSLNVSILHINISRYLSDFNIDSYSLSFTNSFKLLFKIKIGKKNSKIKFISEIGPDISIDMWGIMSQDEADGIYQYTILSGPFLFLGFEFIKNSFSLETGGFLEGLFGSVYNLTEIIYLNGGGIKKYYEKTESQYILKFGTSIRIGYSYLKKIN